MLPGDFETYLDLLGEIKDNLEKLNENLEYLIHYESTSSEEETR